VTAAQIDQGVSERQGAPWQEVAGGGEEEKERERNSQKMHPIERRLYCNVADATFVK